MKKMSLAEFTEATASGKPVPGGGSVAALSGSLAAALTEMVANLTTDSSELKGVVEKAAKLREILLDLAEEDSDAFSKVIEAYRTPDKTPEEKKHRKSRILHAMKHAAEVPMKTAELSYSVMELAEKVVRHGNRNAVTDGMVSAIMARSAVLSSLLNVRINLSSIKDDDYVSKMTIKADGLEESCRRYEDEIIKNITF